MEERHFLPSLTRSSARGVLLRAGRLFVFLSAILHFFLFTGSASASSTTCADYTPSSGAFITADCNTGGAEKFTIAVRYVGRASATDLGTETVTGYMSDGTTLGATLFQQTTANAAGYNCTSVLNGSDAFKDCEYFGDGIGKVQVKVGIPASGYTRAVVELYAPDLPGTAGGTLAVHDSSPATQAVTCGNCSGTVTTHDPSPASTPVTGPLTDSQLRASEVPVSDAGTHTALGSLSVTCSSGCGGGGTADTQRADLTWWGVWAIVGLMLALLIAPRFLRAIAPERGLS